MRAKYWRKILRVREVLVGSEGELLKTVDLGAREHRPRADRECVAVPRARHLDGGVTRVHRRLEVRGEGWLAVIEGRVLPQGAVAVERAHLWVGQRLALAKAEEFRHR